jgi:hypothetical protein
MSPQGVMRVEDPRFGRSGLERGRKPREYRPLGLGQLKSVRTDSWREQNFEAGEAGGRDDHSVGDPGQPGSNPSGTAKREPIVRGGIQATVSKAWESGETTSDKVAVGTFCSTVDNCKGASGSEKSTRSSRGENSEGGKLRNGCGMK